MPIRFAPARLENWRCLMRGQLATLAESIRRLAAGEYEAATTATEEHYGFRPGTAEYCHEPIFTRETSLAAAELPPPTSEPVQALFKAMKEAARRRDPALAIARAAEAQQPDVQAYAWDIVLLQR